LETIFLDVQSPSNVVSTMLQLEELR